MAGEIFLTMVIGIVVALVPFGAFAAYLIRGNRKLCTAFFLGWAGWLVALLIRVIPIQIPGVIFADQLMASIIFTLIYVAFLSVMAGLFEEGFRFLFLRWKKWLQTDQKTVLSFALGWGLGEAIILFLPAVLLLPTMSAGIFPLTSILPGAIERNLAILAHVAFTFVVFTAITRKKKSILVLAIFLHFLFNMIAVSTLRLSNDIWVTELVIALVTAGLLLVSEKVSRGFQVKKSLWGNLSRKIQKADQFRKK